MLRPAVLRVLRVLLLVAPVQMFTGGAGGGRRVVPVVVVVMMVALLLRGRDGGRLDGARVSSSHVGDNQLGAVAQPLRAVAGRLVHRLLAAQRCVHRVAVRLGLGTRRLVQVLPRLAVVAVQPTPALGAARVVRRHRVAVR